MNWDKLLELKNTNRIDNLYVEYYQYAEGNDTRVVAEIGGNTFDAYAECSPKDKYIKPYGRNVAAGRLLKILRTKGYIG